MEKTIWKFELSIKDNQKIEMPIGAEILTAQVQKEILCLWALVNSTSEKEIRYFEIFGTGHPVNYDMGTNRKYIGTYQLQDGSLVFHVFEYIGV